MLGEVSISSIFEQYGWYMFFGGVSVIFLYKKFEPYIEKYKREQAEREYSALYHKDVDVVAKRLQAQQAQAQKLQDEYNRQAEDFKKKLEQKEQRKREEWLERHDMEGHVLGGDKNKLKFKPEYNPLTGSGSPSNYRPPKKSCCSGGGCGKK